MQLESCNLPPAPVVVWPRNPFHPADKDLYPIQPGSTITDWMRSQAITEFPLPTVCLVNGQPLLRRDWAIRPLAAHDVVVLVGLPGGGGGGGGGSNPLRVVLSIAVMVLANAIRPNIVASYFNFNPAWINEGDVVMFQGGGNFGDLYPGPQQLREHTIASRLGNRIVILPQTIHFKSDEAYEKCCNKLSKHKDLHIFVRDQRSFELALPMTQHVYLAPDMAHQLWPVRGTQEHSCKGHLGVLRTDDELGRNVRPSGLDRVIDWPELVGKREATTRNIYRALRVLHIARLDRHLVSRASQLWIKRADSLVQEAIDLYSRYEYITTDRLHGHILACLMGIPNTLIDNSYGKNSTYWNQWTAASDIVQLASTCVGRHASA